MSPVCHACVLGCKYYEASQVVLQAAPVEHATENTITVRNAGQRMCMREKAWLAASVWLRLARLPPLAWCGARVTYAPRLRLRKAFSRMLWSQSSKR